MISIEPMTQKDRGAVRRITPKASPPGMRPFETAVPEWEQWNAGHLQVCRLIALLSDEVLGWAALSPVSKRAVYVGVAEVSIYVAEYA